MRSFWNRVALSPGAERDTRMRGEAVGRQRPVAVRWPQAEAAAGRSPRAPGGRVALSTPGSRTRAPRAGGEETSVAASRRLRLC